MRIFGVTMGGPDLAGRVAVVLAEGATVLVRELEIPEGVLVPGVILHARMPGAEAAARRAGLGLHLASDMDLVAFRRRFSGELGVSAHSAAEARAAIDRGADYVFLSPIWAPSSKAGRPPLGLDGVAGCVALGGISPDRARLCREAGAVGIAAMGGIFGAPGAERERVRAFVAAIRG